MPVRQAHPQPRTQSKKTRELVTTGPPKSPGIPCAMVLTAYFVLFPETGFVVSVPLRSTSFLRS